MMVGQEMHNTELMPSFLPSVKNSVVVALAMEINILMIWAGALGLELLRHCCGLVLTITLHLLLTNFQSPSQLQLATYPFSDSIQISNLREPSVDQRAPLITEGTSFAKLVQ